MIKNHDTTFIIDELPAIAGEPVFSYGGRVKNTAPNPRVKKAFKIATVSYLLTVLGFLVFWFIYSFIVALYRYDAIYVIKSFIDDFFALAVSAFIIIVICSGAVPKLFRKIAGKFRQIPAEDTAEPEEAALVVQDGFEVYEGFLVFFKNGERIVVDRGKVLKFTVTKTGSGCSFSVCSAWGDGVAVGFSASKIRKLRRALGGNLGVEKFSEDYYKPSADRGQKRFKWRIEIDGAKAGGFFAGILCLAAGGGLIAMHYCVSKSIPVFLAAFFIAGGVIFFLSMLGDKEIVTSFFIPLIFGGLFTAFPPFICKVVADGNDIPLKWSSVHEFLSSFSGLFAAVGFLMAVGGLLIVIAVINLVKLIKERS